MGTGRRDNRGATHGPKFFLGGWVGGGHAVASTLGGGGHKCSQRALRAAAQNLVRGVQTLRAARPGTQAFCPALSSEARVAAVGAWRKIVSA